MDYPAPWMDCPRWLVPSQVTDLRPSFRYFFFFFSFMSSPFFFESLLSLFLLALLTPPLLSTPDFFFCFCSTSTSRVNNLPQLLLEMFPPSSLQHWAYQVHLFQMIYVFCLFLPRLASLSVCNDFQWITTDFHTVLKPIYTSANTITVDKCLHSCVVS